MKVIILSPEHGDQTLILTPHETQNLIKQQNREKKVAFLRWSDGSAIDALKIPSINTLKTKENQNQTLTLIPTIAGG